MIWYWMQLNMMECIILLDFINNLYWYIWILFINNKIICIYFILYTLLYIPIVFVYCDCVCYYLQQKLRCVKLWNTVEDKRRLLSYCINNKISRMYTLSNKICTTFRKYNLTFLLITVQYVETIWMLNNVYLKLYNFISNFTY